MTGQVSEHGAEVVQQGSQKWTGNVLLAFSSELLDQVLPLRVAQTLSRGVSLTVESQISPVDRQINVLRKPVDEAIDLRE